MDDKPNAGPEKVVAIPFKNDDVPNFLAQLDRFEKRSEEAAEHVEPNPDAPLHSYHCPLCGTQLHEIGLGFLECRSCRHDFVPSCQAEKNEYSLSWIEKD